MSFYMNLLLDPSRRHECALHDAEANHLAFSFIPQEHAMKHVQPIVFRPEVQRTEKEGRRAYLNRLTLHPHATPEAMHGWTREAIADYRAHLMAHRPVSIETAIWR
jgi:hypothetical protein